MRTIIVYVAVAEDASQAEAHETTAEWETKYKSKFHPADNVVFLPDWDHGTRVEVLPTQ